MVQPVFQDVIAVAHKRIDGAQVGRIATRKQQGAGPTGEFRQRSFKFVMGGSVPADEVGRATAGAPVVDTLFESCPDTLVICEPEIVVAAEVQELLAIHDQFPPLCRGDSPPTTVKPELLTFIQCCFYVAETAQASFPVAKNRGIIQA